MRKNNLIGQRVGMLVIVSETSNRSTRGDIYWLAKCDCGVSVKVLASNCNLQVMTRSEHLKLHAMKKRHD